MNCLIWNARGLGSPRAFRSLRQLIADHNPSLLFISESKVSRNKCQRWREIFGFSGQFIVDANGKRGGLLLFWKSNMEVVIQSFSKGHIDSIIHLGEKIWRFTGFYGNPDRALRHFSWSLLENLGSIHELRHLPWVVGGDFNEILFSSEKVGGLIRNEADMSCFHEALARCELRDPCENFWEFT